MRRLAIATVLFAALTALWPLRPTWAQLPRAPLLQLEPVLIRSVEQRRVSGTRTSVSTFTTSVVITMRTRDSRLKSTDIRSVFTLGNRSQTLRFVSKLRPHEDLDEPVLKTFRIDVRGASDAQLVPMYVANPLLVVADEELLAD